MAKLKHDFIDVHNGMRQHKAGDEASNISEEGMAFLKEKGYLVKGEDEEDEAPAADKPTAAVLVEKIKAATTVEEVKAIVGDDERKGVINAANKRIEELSSAE